MVCLLPAEEKSANPWDILPNEPHDWYYRFFIYLNLGPCRTIQWAYKEYLLEIRKVGPGQPIPHVPEEWKRYSVQFDWVRRAKSYDDHNVALVKEISEQVMRDKIKDMVDEHIEGARLFRKAAVGALYLRDEDGNIIYDEETDEPVLVQIQDPSVAMRIFRQSVGIERTAANLPVEILGMSTSKIEARILEIRKSLGEFSPDSQLEDGEEIVDAEYEELDDESNGAEEEEGPN